MEKELEKVDFAFRIYGDNILECEHLITWLSLSEFSDLVLIAKEGALDRQIYIFRDKRYSQTYAFQLCPYFGGTGNETLWPHNPLKDIYNEKPDVVITQVYEDETESKPLIAIEFCDALQAGNQVWQRFRRALNSAEHRIPYLYVLPIIGWERSPDGLSLKNPRYQSAQVCLAQMTLMSRLGVASLQVYTDTGWASFATKLKKTMPVNFEAITGLAHAIPFTVDTLRKACIKVSDKNRIEKSHLSFLIKGMIEIARTYASFSLTSLPIFINHPALQLKNIDTASQNFAEAIVNDKPVEGEFALHSINLSHFVNAGSLFYKDIQAKTIDSSFITQVVKYFNWRNNLPKEDKIAYLERWGINVDKNLDSDKLDELARKNFSKIPVTYKDTKSEATIINNRKVLRDILKERYANLDESILNWIYSGNDKLPPLLLIFLYGYKPSGDSRPDRGIIPAICSLFPSISADRQVLILVYSKYTPKSWKHSIEQKNNELWNVIASLAGAVIVDVTKDGMLFAK